MSVRSVDASDGETTTIVIDSEDTVIVVPHDDTSPYVQGLPKLTYSETELVTTMVRVLRKAGSR